MAMGFLVKATIYLSLSRTCPVIVWWIEGSTGNNRGNTRVLRCRRNAVQSSVKWLGLGTIVR